MTRHQAVPILCVLLLVLALSACGTLQVGIEPTPTRETGAPLVTVTKTVLSETATVASATPTPTSAVTGWATYTNQTFDVSLQYPPRWQPAPGEENRYAGDDGFFAIDAIGNAQATIDEIAADQVGHRLRPFGRQPTIETLEVQGQEARLILPSTDVSTDSPAMLIVRYPQPIDLGQTCQFFVLYADPDHIQTIAHTVRFGASASATATPQHARESPPPGLVYRLLGDLWLVDADGQEVQISSDPQAVLSPDGTKLLTYNLADRDPWLLDLTTGTGMNLAHTSARAECCFRWWSERPSVVLMNSVGQESEPQPGLMGRLAAADVDGTGYRLLDDYQDVGPGEFSPSPDGKLVAFGGGGVGWVYWWGAGTDPFDPVSYGLTGTKELQIGSPAFSPDGARLAWVVGGGLAADGGYRIGIGVFDLEARTARLVHPYAPVGRGGWPPAPVWSPDGRWLAFAAWAQDQNETGIWVVSADGEQELAHHLGPGYNPVWSPNGTWLAYNHTPQEGETGRWIAAADMSSRYPLNLPSDAYVVDWISPRVVMVPEALAPTPASTPEVNAPASGDTPATPSIDLFQAAPTVAGPGDAITLMWEASGDHAIICPRAAFVLFTSQDCWQVPPTGETTFTIPSDVGGNRFIDLVLTVEAEDASEPAVWQVSIALKCHTKWFFTDDPQAGICPVEPTHSYAAAQRFERGMMVWVEQLGRYFIFHETLLYDQELRKRVDYVQDPLDILRDTSAQPGPPEGLYAPESGFGLIWRGDVSGSPGYHETLGWALSPEFGYDAIYQCDGVPPSGGRSWQTCHLLGPDDEVIVLHPLGGWYLLDEQE
jgi:TolB protein